MARFSLTAHHLKIYLAIAACAVAVWLSLSTWRTRGLAANTLTLSGLAAAASVVVGMPLAMLLARTDLPGRRSAGLLLTSLLFIPLYLQAAAWQAACGLQGEFTAAGGWLHPLEGLTGAVVVHTAAAIPWVVMIVGLGLKWAEPALEEDALLHARAGRVFLLVTSRRAAGAAGVAALWVAITTAGEMTVTDLYQVRTYAEELYTQFALGEGFASVARLALPTVALTAVLIAAGLAVTARLAPQQRVASHRGPLVFRLGRWRWPATLLVWSVIGGLVGLPLGSLVAKAGTVISRTPDGWSRHWSMFKFVSHVAAGPGRCHRPLGWSLLTGGTSATVATLVALPLAFWARQGRAAAGPAWWVIAIGLALPGPLVGIGLIWLLNQPAAPLLTWLYDRTIFAPAAAQIIRVLPLATLVLWHSLRTLPDELFQSASTEGAGPWRALLLIGLPARWRGVAVAWLIALAAAMGELAGAILVTPPGMSNLAVYIFGLVHYGVDDRLAGICLAVAGGYLVLATATLALARKAGWSES